MPYTSPDQVASVIKVTAGDDLQPFLDTAAQIVTDVCLTSGYSDDKLELIERWLSAHMYCAFKERRSAERVSGPGGGVAQTFQPFKVDLYFNNTRYGQTAVELDTKGNLAALQQNLRKGGKAVTKSVGPCPRWGYGWYR